MQDVSDWKRCVLCQSDKKKITTMPSKQDSLKQTTRNKEGKGSKTTSAGIYSGTKELVRVFESRLE